MQASAVSSVLADGRRIDMEEISQTIQLLSEDTLSKISKGPLVKFTQECDNVDKVSRVWQSLLKTFSTASIPSSHTTASCLALSAFLDAASVSKCEGTRQLAQSPDTWLSAFEVFITRFEDAKPKPMKLVITSLVKLLAKSRQEPSSHLIQAGLVDAILPSIILGEPRARLKASLVSLEVITRKSAILPHEVISMLQVWLSKNSEKWISLLQEDCKALSMDFLLISDETSRSTKRVESRRLAVQILLLGLLNQAKNPELASSAGDTIAAFFQKLKTDPGLAQDERALLSVWIPPVRYMVLQNIDNLEHMSNYVLQPLFLNDRTGFLSFLDSLPLKHVFAGDMADAALPELTLLFASLQVAKKTGLVDEDYGSSKQGTGMKLSLPSEVIGQFLFHREFSIRIAALSLLISAPATTKPLSSAAIRAILRGLPSMHAESDPYSRGETISLIRKLIVRLKGGILDNRDGSSQEELSTDTKQQAKSARGDSESRACLAAYIGFLKTDMRPTASYPRHIMALKTINLFLQSGLDSRVKLTKHVKMEEDKVRWKFNIEIFDLSLIRLLVDLLLDPFEEVRATSLTILNLAPRDMLLGGLPRSVDRSSAMSLRLTDALTKAEQLASNTSRADHADTVARLYHIIFCAAAETHSGGDSQWWETKKGVVDLLLKKLEGKVSNPGGLFTTSMRDAPLHGYVSALRYIVSTSNFHQLISDPVSATGGDWRLVHTRIVSICDRIWEEVKPVLCIDSPEGHSDEPIEEFNIGPKDILSYSWRALRESSLLLHATLANATYAPQGESGFTADDYEKIGMSSFTQLAELRHRGAFSTVSQTFATCCQRCGQSNDPAISALPQRWYQEARKIIFEAASQLTRRSAGLPALATGIILSKPGGPLFRQVIDELHEIAHLPAEHDRIKQKVELPQVHAMNCLKDIFTNTKLGPFTEPYIMPALTLSAERLGSPIWALRNSGLMLFRALLTRMCRLLTGANFGFGGSSGSEPGARISFHKYPGLLHLLSNLLAPTDKKQTSQFGDHDIVTERVFPALELIAEKVPSVSDDDDILLRNLVREQFKSPVWGIREHSARVYASLLKRADILTEIRALLEIDRGLETQDFLHGKALCAKYALRRFASISLPFWNNHLSEVASVIQDILAALFPCAHSPFVATTLIEILNDAVEKSIESGAEDSAIRIVNHASDVFAFEDILNFLFDSSHPHWKTLNTTRAASLLRRVLAWTAVLRMLISGNVENLESFFQNVSRFDSNAGRWIIEQMQAVLGERGRYRETVLTLYSSVIRGSYTAEVKMAAVSSLETILRIVLESRGSDMKEIGLPWDALHEQIDSKAGEQTSNRDMSNVELRLQGCLLTIRASLNHWKGMERDIRRWATRLRFAMQEETEFTTRHAAVTSLTTFGRVLRPVGSPPQVDAVFLEIYLILYDMLNDDDEELRELAASIASWILSYSTVSPSKAVTLAPRYASDLLSKFIVDNYAQSSFLCTRIIQYVTGQAPKVSGSVDKPRLKAVPDQLREHRKESTILFEEEKQNLFIDEVREADVWAAMLLRMAGSSFDPDLVHEVTTWVLAGLSYICEFAVKEAGNDGLLGWASKPETFTLGVRVISIAGILFEACQSPEASLSTMISSLTIAVVLLAVLGLVAIGVALTFKWRTEVRRNLRLQREETRQRDAHAIAAQLLSAREERGRRSRSRSAAPRPSIQNRTRRSSRRVSPIGRHVQRNEVRRSTTRAENTVHRQQWQKPSTPPPPPTGVPPSSPVQPAAPPSSPPKPSTPVAAATDDEWQTNDAQPNTQESQGQAEGQYDPWGASDAAQAQNSQGQTEGGWKATDAFAPAQDTQGERSGDGKASEGTTTKATEEAKPAEPEAPNMWNDEDNNPYGAFDNEARLSESLHSAALSPPLYEREHSPSPSSRSSNQDPPDYVSRPQDLSDEDESEDYGAQQTSHGYPRKNHYESRIEQILYENPDMPILITDAGKNHEGGGSFIVYTIRTGDLEVRRRYSEFASLRQTLVNLHPTLVIPPIPEKHTMADYAAKPTKAKEDSSIIDLRKRMLAVFLNRCRRMKEVREDGVWWRFLDPNVSWSEVLHSHPASSVPKNNLKAPPLDPANPTAAHSWLPVPSSSAKLKSATSGATSGTTDRGDASASVPGPDVLGRFPPESKKLSEQDLDPYFINFEASTRELELLLQGNIEKVNRRTLAHLSSLSADLMELGARYNGFSLSEQSPTVAAAIERIGQAADTSYIATEELSTSLSASFAEPMRESAQFASVVRSVLRYRVLKRVQEEMTRDELAKKKTLLDSLERSELEAKRIEQYLNRTSPQSATNRPQRSLSVSSVTSGAGSREGDGRSAGSEDTASADSDFPPTHGEAISSQPQPQPYHTSPPRRPELGPSAPLAHRKTSSGTFVANKIFGRISHAIHGFADVDPERTRRDQIGKTKESLIQLEQALEVSEKDVKDASAGVLQDLKRFQKDKEADLRRYMVAYARCHLDWARKNLETWTEAKDEVDKIVAR
ncbi:hypothetical protein CNMCM7691_002657 [Aspergillus felis]|uniref:PX domain-containing protein n=1 Tax=Aspergillus felis TaxID=1287682 RepID=A0A8H6R1T0_9EURO|nr:hypothetical protein CNMCM7691_002657 [Aspergillus felis]